MALAVALGFVTNCDSAATTDSGLALTPEVSRGAGSPSGGPCRMREVPPRWKAGAWPGGAGSTSICPPFLQRGGRGGVGVGGWGGGGGGGGAYEKRGMSGKVESRDMQLRVKKIGRAACLRIGREKRRKRQACDLRMLAAGGRKRAPGTTSSQAPGKLPAPLAWRR